MTRIDKLLAEFMRQVDAGVANREEFLAAHPDEAETLRDLLLTEDTILRLAGPREQDVDPLAETQPLAVPGKEGSASDMQAAPEAADGGPQDPGETTAEQAAPLPFGNYELLEILGRGGMGVVYRARQKGLDREVALKMILNAHLASAEEIERFYIEARAAANIRHPHVVHIHEIGEVDGQHYFSMELVEGADLAHTIREGRLESRRAARLLRDAARAVHAAHERGLLHRDIKPANILVDLRDRVVVTDFGLAKEIDPESHLTATGLAMGTPSYMSPEQAAGLRERMGPPSDVFSLGAVLFAMLTGRPPHRASTVMDTLMSVIHDPPSHPTNLNSDADPVLCRICMKCLEKDPDKRYAAACELADDLDRYLSGHAVAAQDASRVAKCGRWLGQIPVVAALRGRPSPRPTAGQLRAQAAIVLAVLLSAVLAVTLPRVRHAIRNRLPAHVLVAGGAVDGAFDQFASRLAAALSDRAPCQASALRTEGSGVNRRLLLEGGAHLALLQEAMVGSDEIVVVAPLFDEVVHVVGRRGRLDSWQDLPQATLAIGPPGSGMAATARQVLAGVDAATVREVDFRVLHSDESLDGALITIAVDSPSLARLLADPDLQLLSLPEAVIARVAADPQYRVLQIQAPDGAAVSTVATPAFLASRRDVPEALVRETLNCLYPADSETREHDIRRASHWSFMPMHPVARRFFERAEQ